jgi:hypothetical protein
MIQSSASVTELAHMAQKLHQVIEGMK